MRKILKIIKPYLRITRRENIAYLSVKYYEKGKDKTLRSFGNASNPENWNEAIECLLVENARYYHKLKEEYIKK